MYVHSNYTKRYWYITEKELIYRKLDLFIVNIFCNLEIGVNKRGVVHQLWLDLYTYHVMYCYVLIFREENHQQTRHILE
jgi:hypothetical protein